MTDSVLTPSTCVEIDVQADQLQRASDMLRAIANGTKPRGTVQTVFAILDDVASMLHNIAEDHGRI